MNRTALLVLIACMLAMLGASLGLQDAENSDPATPGARFAPVEIWLDTADQPLAAYQLEFSPADTGNVKIVGIEGGEPGVFAEPPYYDPAAMMRERVIIADFSTAKADALPRGRFRIATIHVQITGDQKPSFETSLDVAATIDGKPIPVQAETITGYSS